MKTLFRNGSIHTMNGTEVVHSLLVEDGRILDVNCDVPAGECQVVDLHGKTVLPGFHDSHEHFLCYATDKEKINFFGIRSLEEMAERTRRYIADRGIKKGEWIQGGGWNENEFDVPVLPSRQDLDKFCPDNPAIFTRTCCSVAVANTAALKAADRNPYSWNMDYYEYPDGSGYEARFTKCGICTLTKELGLYDLTPALCRLDYAMSDAGGASEFVREYTLASGGPYCDCGYKKKNR